MVAQGLATNEALLVVGLHSFIVAYLGRGNRESPYHFVAISGFVAFVLILFWSKLHIRVAHAYLLPVGIGVLILVQMFRRWMTSETSTGVRLVTLLVMLGSAGYYALIDERHPITFNLTLLLLGLAAMALGGFFRIRLYVFLGFAGIMVDLCSIAYKVLGGMKPDVQMISIGSLVLMLGTALVVGAIYYKINQAQIVLQIDTWRRRLGEWE